MLHLAHIIENGLRHGFRIGFNHESVQLGSSSRNHPSSQERPGIIADHLHEELRQGRVVGPIHPSLVIQVYTSPIGLVPKPHSSKWCQEVTVLMMVYLPCYVLSLMPRCMMQSVS